MPKPQWKPGESANPETQWKPGQTGNPNGRMPPAKVGYIRAIIQRCHIRAYSLQEIAEELQRQGLERAPGVQFNTRWIARQIKIIRDRWRMEAAEYLQTQQVTELHRLQHALHEAWAAYQRTIGKRITVTKEGRTAGEDDTARKVTIKEEDLPGAAEWMSVIVGIHKRIAELLDLDQVTKSNREAILKVIYTEKQTSAEE